MSRVLSCQTGMPVTRLMMLYDDFDGIKVRMRWKGIPHSDDNFELLRQVFEDVSAMLVCILDRKNIPPDWAQNVRGLLRI